MIGTDNTYATCRGTDGSIASYKQSRPKVLRTRRAESRSCSCFQQAGGTTRQRNRASHHATAGSLQRAGCATAVAINATEAAKRISLAAISSQASSASTASLGPAAPLRPGAPATVRPAAPPQCFVPATVSPATPPGPLAAAAFRPAAPPGPLPTAMKTSESASMTIVPVDDSGPAQHQMPALDDLTPAAADLLQGMLGSLDSIGRCQDVSTLRHWVSILLSKVLELHKQAADISSARSKLQREGVRTIHVCNLQMTAIKKQLQHLQAAMRAERL